ncbi:hypothetical protein PM082_013704 [Marasmius tenuissimus]|nr:hypothetical protein PM082_013704 [Marasmius tenuissimus]
MPNTTTCTLLTIVAQRKSSRRGGKGKIIFHFWVICTCNCLACQQIKFLELNFEGLGEDTVNGLDLHSTVRITHPGKVAVIAHWVRDAVIPISHLGRNCVQKSVPRFIIEVKFDIVDRPPEGVKKYHVDLLYMVFFFRGRAPLPPVWGLGLGYGWGSGAPPRLGVRFRVGAWV